MVCSIDLKYYEIIYNDLIFAVFHLWRLAITTLDKHSCSFIIIFAGFLPNDDSDIIFQSS